MVIDKTQCQIGNELHGSGDVAGLGCCVRLYPSKKSRMQADGFLKGASLSQPRPFKGLSSKTQSFKDLLQKRQQALLRLVTVKRGTSSANNRL